MAKVIKNEKGFHIIKMNRLEAVCDCNFGIDNVLICDDCNKECFDEELYYIAVLNMIFCKKCFEDWYNKAINYPEDKKYERDNFKIVSMLLDNLEEDDQ